MAFQAGFSTNSSSSGSPEPPPTKTGSSVSPWMQVPPSIMPWTVDRPNLVRFGDAEREDDFLELSNPKNKFFKRKADMDFNPRPSKMHITEEKVAAQLQNMHISNTYMDELGGVEKRTTLLPTLFLSKEVQNLPSFREPLNILPESLLPKVEQPTRALVLWKPPGGSLTSQLIARFTNSETEKEGESGNNNSSTPDLNRMSSSQSTVTSMEMDL